jgi:hypothetical protein
VLRDHLDPEDVQSKKTVEVLQQSLVVGGALSNAVISKSTPESFFTLILLILYFFLGQKR